MTGITASARRAFDEFDHFEYSLSDPLPSEVCGTFAIFTRNGGVVAEGPYLNESDIHLVASALTYGFPYAISPKGVVAILFHNNVSVWCGSFRYEINANDYTYDTMNQWWAALTENSDYIDTFFAAVYYDTFTPSKEAGALIKPDPFNPEQVLSRSLAELRQDDYLGGLDPNSIPDVGDDFD